MNRFLSLFLMTLLGSFVWSSTNNMAYAQEAKGIVITPKRIVFEKGERILEVLLANRGTSEQRFRITLVNRAMQENGQLKETDTPAEGEYFASDVVRHSPRQIVLGSKETQKVRLMSRMKADSPDGEYRSHLLIQEIPKAKEAESAQNVPNDALGIDIRAIFGVTIPVIMRKGTLTAESKLSNPKIVKVNENTFVELTVERSGTKSFMGTANVFMGDQKIGTLKNISVYLSTPHRIVQIKIGAEFADRISEKPLRVTYGPEVENEDAPETEVTFTP